MEFQEQSENNVSADFTDTEVTAGWRYRDYNKDGYWSDACWTYSATEPDNPPRYATWGRVVERVSNTTLAATAT